MSLESKEIRIDDPEVQLQKAKDLIHHAADENDWLKDDLRSERERIDDLQEINDSLVMHSNKRIAELEEIETDLNSTLSYAEMGVDTWKKRAEELELDKAQLQVYLEESRSENRHRACLELDANGTIERLKGELASAAELRYCQGCGCRRIFEGIEVGLMKFVCIHCGGILWHNPSETESMNINLTETFSPNQQSSKLRPGTNLPECRWQVNEDGKIMCGRSRVIGHLANRSQYTKPCSKRCDCPEPKHKKPILHYENLEMEPSKIAKRINESKADNE